MKVCMLFTADVFRDALFPSSSNASSATQISEVDFDVHRIIGRGGFGEVFPCRKRDTGAVYVLCVSCDPRPSVACAFPAALTPSPMLFSRSPATGLL